jgi:YihY family inner membrane protein
MSVPTTVPETHGQSGDDARDEVRRVGVRRLAINAAKRFHAADGTSYARALGLSSVLSLLPGLIGAVGLAIVFQLEDTRAVLEDAIRSLAPGPAGSVLTQALRPGSSGLTAMVGGLGAMLISGTFAMIHLERGANRIYGVDEHRAGSRRLLIAFAVGATAGILLLLGLAVIAAGGAIGESSAPSGSTTGSATDVWSVLRWPIGVALVAVPMTMIFKVAPNRRQPHFSWLLSGTAVAVALWILVTLSLGLFYEHGPMSGAYGPILGVMALLVWAYLTAVAVLYGLSFAAELEAERAGEGSPERDASATPDDRPEDEVRREAVGGEATTAGPTTPAH